jgi:uroporphyrinogen-III synthase
VPKPAAKIIAFIALIKFNVGRESSFLEKKPNTKTYFFLTVNANLQKFYQPLQFYKMSNLEIKKTYGLVGGPLNSNLISELKQNGEDVLVFPAINTSKSALSETGVSFIKNPSDFDWIIFTDIFAADYFIEALREYEKDFFELDNLLVCALGESVSDRLRFVQVHADVIPPNTSAGAVFSEISQFAGGVLRDLRFLTVREETSRYSFIEMLRHENAAVEELPIYKAEFDEEREIIKLKTLLQGGAVDEFIFSSAEEVLGLKLLFPETELAKILNEVKTSAANENTFHALLENNLRPLYFHRK